IRGLIVNDSNLGILEVVGNILPRNDALLIISTAGTEGVPQSAISIYRISGTGRDFKNSIFCINFGSRNGDTGVKMPNDNLHTIGGKFVSDRNALFRIGYVIAKGDGDLFTIKAPGIIDLLDCSFRSFMNQCPIV